MEAARREFITKALFAVLGVLGLGMVFPALRVLTPGRLREQETAFFPLLPEEEVPRIGVKKAELAYSSGGRDLKARVFLVSSPDGLTAFSAVCTHLGCLVNYRRDKQEFICPCHGGRYDLTGRNIDGPPPAPLTRFPVRLREGMIWIGIKV